jgi:hypothetical protein
MAKAVVGPGIVPICATNVAAIKRAAMAVSFRFVLVVVLLFLLFRYQLL